MQILSKWQVYVILLLACNTELIAQNHDDLTAFAFNDNLQSDFLPYKTANAESKDMETDFKAVTVKSVPISIKVRDTVPRGLNKEYLITDDGSFQYCYPKEGALLNAKKGFKPITMRTFYLEASRNGIIPSDISYHNFSKLSIPEKQELLNNEPISTGIEIVEDVQAGVITYKTSPTGLQVFLSIGDKEMELLPRDRNSVLNTRDVQIKYLSKPRSVPLIVKVLTDPLDRIGIPGQVDFNTWRSALNQIASINQQ